MLVIPAIDLKDGQCVRLRRGKMNDCTVYSKDPAAVAHRWESEGARFLHVVDLDGARDGYPRNRTAIEAIINAVHVPVEVGGGIRDARTLEEYLEEGADRVVLGTLAYQIPQFVHDACRQWRERIALSVDAVGGNVAVKGWASVTEERAVDFAKRFEDYGIAAVVYTDIDRDGTLSGVNYNGVEEFARSVDIPVIASGGVASLTDIFELKRREDAGIAGVIVGQALYKKTIDLKEAISIGEGTGSRSTISEKKRGGR